MIEALTQTLAYMANGDYHGGRKWARTQLQNEDGELLHHVLQTEDDPARLEVWIDQCRPEARIAAFADLYFTARIVIYSSYAYQGAIHSIISALPLLDCMETEACPNLMRILKAYGHIQVPLCEIDRSIYLDDAPALQRACADVMDRCADIRAISNDLYGPWKDAFDRHLSAALSRHNHMASALSPLAIAHERKWDQRLSPQELADLETQVGQSIRDLRSQERYGTASEIMPSLRTLQAFHAYPEQSAELFIQRGAIKYEYFAVVDPALEDLLERDLSDLCRTGDPKMSDLAAALSAFGAMQVDREELSDLWDPRAERDRYVHEWQFADLCVTNPNSVHDPDILLDCKLIFLGHGLIRLDITLPVHNISASQFKKFSQLSEPFAFDTSMSLMAAGTSDTKAKTYGFLRDFADDIFRHISSALIDIGRLAKRESLFGTQPLLWSSWKNRLAIERVDVVSVGSSGTGLSAREFAALPTSPHILLEAREVRSALSNWTLRPPPDPNHNLAPLRYGTDEAFFIRPNHALIALLDQPRWASHQAVETAEFAASVLNLVDLTLAHVDGLLARDMNEADESTSRRLSIDDLDALEQVVGRRISVLNLVAQSAYPDQVLMLEKILGKFKIDQKIKALNLAFEQIKIIRKRLSDKRDKTYRSWLSVVLAFGTGFLAIEALDIALTIIFDYFEITIASVARFGLILFGFLATVTTVIISAKFEKK